jgi:hypothetical protein
MCGPPAAVSDERSTTMTNEQTNALVLKDAAGSYFLVPQAVLEQGRVPAEHTAELEQLIAAGGPDGDDVQGHRLRYLVLGPLTIAVLEVFPPDLPHDTLVEVPTIGELFQQMIDAGQPIQ